MGLKTLEFDSLKEIDHGSLEVAVNQALRSIFFDCTDRPALKKGRKLTLELDVTPKVDKRGQFSHASVNFNVKTSMPAKGVEVVMRPSADGKGLEFNPSFSESPDQMTLLDDEDDEG